MGQNILETLHLIGWKEGQLAVWKIAFNVLVAGHLDFRVHIKKALRCNKRSVWLVKAQSKEKGYRLLLLVGKLFQHGNAEVCDKRIA